MNLYYHLVVILITTCLCKSVAPQLIGSNAASATNDRVIEIKYLVTKPLRMNYTGYKSLDLVLTIDKNYIPAKDTEFVTVNLKTVPITPDFSILDIDGSTEVSLNFTVSELQSNKYTRNVNLLLHANYIGHAVLKPDSVIFSNKYSNITTKTLPLPETEENNLKVIITQDEGVWGLIFKISVALLITISYINLGAQLDLDNMKDIIRKPTPLILGLLISIFVMPILSWFLSKWLLRDQLIYRIGTFTFASGPAASASTLWAAIFDSDKELSVGLQIASTLSALLTMPMLLYFMDLALESEGGNSYGNFQSPYGRLIGALTLILVALVVGWYFIGRNPKGQKISRKIFKPLTYAILLFIIIFSSILYWHIYAMFNWTIVLTTFLITISTYLISGVLGHLINCNKDTSIAISIGSTYKNSGIAFAVLLIAFEAPDLYIAYVPCLTQVLTTSLVLNLFYLFYYLHNYLKRRGQPEEIQATRSDSVEAPELGTKSGATNSNEAKECKSGSIPSNGKCVEENEELVAMNVTDSGPGSPVSVKQSVVNHNESSDYHIDCSDVHADVTGDDDL